MKNVQKVITKYENAFVILAAADVLLSLTKNSQGLMRYTDIDAYITDDNITDMSTYVNYSLLHVDIPESARDTFNNITETLLDIAAHINDDNIIKTDNTYYTSVTEQANSFIKTYDYFEYAEFIRRIAHKTHNLMAFQAMIYLLDFFYMRDYMYLSLDKNSKILYGLNCSSQRLPVALCYINTIDNVTNYKLCLKFAEMIAAYVKLKFPNVNTIMNFLENNLMLVVQAVKFHKTNCITNKFMLDAPSYTYHSLLPYLKKMVTMSSDAALIMLNLLVALPPDILKRRRFILKNGPLPFDITLPLACVFNEYADETVTDVTLKEETVIIADTEYRMIYLTYSYCNHTQTISINLNDIHVQLSVLNTVDLFLVMYLLDLYEVFDVDNFEDQAKHFQSLFGNYLPNYGKDDTKSEKSSNTPRAKYRRLLENAEITVGAYVRKLPDNQTASDEAKALAKKLYLNLPPDCTVVSEHIRKYHK